MLVNSSGLTAFVVKKCQRHFAGGAKFGERGIGCKRVVIHCGSDFMQVLIQIIGRKTHALYARFSVQKSPNFVE